MQKVIVIVKRAMHSMKSMFSCREPAGSHRLMTLIVLGLGVTNFLFGEVVPAGGGFGWDGVTYANITKNFPSLLANGELSPYYAQRILPACVVRGMLLASGASFDNLSIIRGFQIYNLALLFLATFIWKRIANRLSITLSGRWLGFCGLFLSFNVSKVFFYYPVLTDQTAFVVGLLLLLYYLESRPVPLLIVTILGAFVWQVVSICGALLLLFPREKLPINCGGEAASGFNKPCGHITICWGLLWGGLLVVSVVGVLAGYFILLWIPADRVGQAIANHGVAWLVQRVGYWCSRLFTGLPSLIGLIGALWMLVGFPYCYRALLSNLNSIRLSSILFTTIGFVTPAIIVHAISNPAVPKPIGFSLAEAFLLPPIGKLLLPLVSLAAFWGPMTILICIKWSAFCKEAKLLGLGFVCVIAFNMLLALATEPRFVTLGWPFAVLGGVIAMEQSNKSRSFWWAFATLVVVYGQFWLKLNISPWTGGDSENLSEFPKQMVFMHYGVWMSTASYVLYGISVILSLAWLRVSLRDTRMVPC